MLISPQENCFLAVLRVFYSGIERKSNNLPPIISNLLIPQTVAKYGFIQ
jgi:hypothetical protein